jgi:formylglycine-generating enzyme
MRMLLAIPLPLLIFALISLLIGCAREPDPVIVAGDGSEMVYIPPGVFAMGARASEFDDRPELMNYRNYEAERPLHDVQLDAFYIDRFEISNKQYGEFLTYLATTDDRAMEHAGQPAEVNHGQRYLDEAQHDDDMPAVGLNWFDAYAYCSWAEKRLPTEAEWEYAARGGDGVYRMYPWGNELPDADGIWRANYWPKAARAQDGYRYTAPLGSFPDGISPFGVMDMAGNAEEWVQDWLDFAYYKRPNVGHNPKGPASGANKVIKGGSQISDRHHLRIGTRLYGAPQVKSASLGVRCARDL